MYGKLAAATPEDTRRRRARVTRTLRAIETLAQRDACFESVGVARRGRLRNSIKQQHEVFHVRGSALQLHSPFGLVPLLKVSLKTSSQHSHKITPYLLIGMSGIRQ